MADVLFDTTVFIDYYRGDTGAQGLLEQILTGVLTASYSSITVFELWLGTMTAEEAATHQDVLSLLEDAGLDSNAARKAADLLKLVPSEDRERMIRDAFIAATASERSEPIYTRNTRHFQRFDVEVRTY